MVKAEYVNGYPKYTVVNSSGLVDTLVVGEFELLDTGIVGFNSNIKTYSVTITIREIRIDEIFQLSIDGINDVSVYTRYIIPFLKTLNEHGSYKSYKQSLELDKLKRQIDELTRLLEECRGKEVG